MYKIVVKNSVIKDIIKGVILELLEELLTNGIILIEIFFWTKFSSYSYMSMDKNINLYDLNKLYNSLNARVVITACV